MVERTTDMRVVRAIITHPQVYPYVGDDGTPPVEQYQPPEHESVFYLLWHDGTNAMGCWMFVTVNAVTLAVHTCLLPGHPVKAAREAAAEALRWVWANTRAQRVITEAPLCNRAARKFAVAVGMQKYGQNPGAWLKGGQLWDIINFGISRPQEAQ